MQFGTPVPLLIGLILIAGAVGLFFLDRIKPGYGRDADKVYAVLLLIAGFCALGELQMGIFPSFQLLIMTGMLVTLFIENVRNRIPLEPLRPVGVPPRRPVNRPQPDRRPEARRPIYRAELDDWDRIDDRSRRSMPPQRSYEDDRYRPQPPYDDRRPVRQIGPGGSPRNGWDGDRPDRPPYDDRRDDRREAPSDGPSERPGPRRPPGPSSASGYGSPGALSNGDRGPADADRYSPSRDSERGLPERGLPERGLNVRPYSEGPEARRPDSGYADFRPVEPDSPG